MTDERIVANGKNISRSFFSIAHLEAFYYFHFLLVMLWVAPTMSF